MAAALRALADIYAAGYADSAADPPLTQAQADLAAALTAPHLPRIRAQMTAAQAVPAA